MTNGKQKRSKRCYLCGEINASTEREHVIPRCLFDTPPPPNLISAPACKKCNNSLSKDEEFFRVFVLAQSYEHPVAKKLWKEKVKASFSQSPRFRQMLASKVFPASTYSPAGLYLGDVSVLYADQVRINAVLAKIVKGLFYRIKKTYFQGQIILVTHDIYHPENWKSIEDLPGREFGDAIFKYKYVMNDLDPHHSWWQLVFYNKVLFTIATAPIKQLN